MRISVFGLGYLGTITCACLTKLGHHVIGVDVRPEAVRALGEGRTAVIEQGLDTLLAEAVAGRKLATTDNADLAVNESDISFITVDTPGNPDGSVSLAAVDAVLDQIGKALAENNKPHAVVMRSTVPIGTAEAHAIPALEQTSGRALGDSLAYYSNPEFLREGNAVSDFFEPALSLIGHASGDPATILHEIYADLKSPSHLVPFATAESVKVVSNVFHAVKMTFANEAGAVLAKLGLDARDIFKLVCEDRVLNISPAYMRPGFAFGGHCLPKDIAGFLHIAGEMGTETAFISSLLSGNAKIIDRTVDLIDPQPGQQVLILGLAFKPGTNDLRNSPYVELAERLVTKGSALRIFDPVVARSALPQNLTGLLASDVGDAVRQARTVVIGHLPESDRPRLIAALKDQKVIDLLGLPDVAAMPGVTYRGLCW